MSAFEHSTGWVVITGAPSSGKTSVIEDLRARGYAVQGEVARELIEECLRRGLSVEDVRRDGGKQLQQDILRIKSKREAALDPAECVFMDRGMPDSMAYFRLAGLDVAMAAQACMMFRYAAVFIFDRLPLVKDGIRAEDEAAAQKIDDMLRADYQSLGYDPIAVPVMPVTQRSDFILQALGMPLQVQAAVS
ncbi:MAG: ATP-binding protein [Alphaproteobacteria bacterium]|nr:ATP-binding protein [Alphaproteobacteria bacterium]